MTDDNTTTVATAEAKPNCAPVNGSVTVAYSITDDNAWHNSGNPLKWEHHGLKAHTVSIYDAFERLEIMREALEKIADGCCSRDEAEEVAKKALDESQNVRLNDGENPNRTTRA